MTHVFHFTRSNLFLCTECPSATKGHHVGVMSYRTRSVAPHVPGIDITPSPAITPETLPPPYPLTCDLRLRILVLTNCH